MNKNQYNVHNQALLIRPSVETVVKIAIYAEQKGITRAMAAKRLMESHPILKDIQLTEEDQKKAEAMVQHNIDLRNRKDA